MKLSYCIIPANPEHLALLPEIERAAAAIFPPKLLSSEQIVHSLCTPHFAADLSDKFIGPKDKVSRQHFGILELDLLYCLTRWC